MDEVCLVKKNSRLINNKRTIINNSPNNYEIEDIKKWDFLESLNHFRGDPISQLSIVVNRSKLKENERDCDKRNSRNHIHFRP